MRITVNGESIGLEDRYTASDLIERYHLADRPCAVEINRQLVPKAHHREHRLTEGDEVEIVTLVGGG
jgi:thiamine biosynthesis protein ThiS